MSSIVATLNELILNIYTYVGAVEIVLGTIGNILTLLIYRQRPLRSTRTAPYIMILAVLNTIFLDGNAIPRVIASVWRRLDTTFGKEFICPLRTTILWTCLTLIMLILPLLAFDRYLCSCRQISRRQWSTAKFLRNGMVGIILFALLTNWPYIFYVQLTLEPTLRIISCSITDASLVQFNLYFQTLVIFSILPVVLLVVFGSLTVRNIRTVRQTSNQFERQMTRILALQTILNACALIPYCAQTLYAYVTFNEQKTQLSRTIQQLIFVIFLHVYYLLFCSHFYLSLVVSKEVRAQIRALLHIPPVRPTNQVLPASQIRSLM